MYKLSYDILKKMIEKKTTGKEIDFLIYLSKIQSEEGKVEGIQYKEVCKALEISVQKFYDLLDGLKEKGLISVVQAYYGDYDVTILGNDFSGFKEVDYREGLVRYLSTNHKLFDTSLFKRLSGLEKLFVLDLFNTVKTGKNFGFQIGREKFVEKYSRLFLVQKRTIQKYLKNLRLFFKFELRKRQYRFQIRSFMLEKVVGVGKRKAEVEKDGWIKQTIKTACRRNKIKTIEEKERKDTEGLFLQYRTSISKVKFTEVVSESVQILSDSLGSRSRRLKASLVHRVLREALGM